MADNPSTALGWQSNIRGFLSKALTLIRNNPADQIVTPVAVRANVTYDGETIAINAAAPTIFAFDVDWVPNVGETNVLLDIVFRTVLTYSVTGSDDDDVLLNTTNTGVGAVGAGTLVPTYFHNSASPSDVSVSRGIRLLCLVPNSGTYAGEITFEPASAIAWINPLNIFVTPATLRCIAWPITDP